jgi:cytochrome bd ubiquinol oxidase subunit I
MDNLLAARSQMALSLGFHIVFTCIGMTMPWLMAFAEWRWLRTREPLYRDLAVLWSKCVAVFFAVGAVSGTVLSFELGLLWPTFMQHAGPIIGLPFSWEGTAFFLEAIAIGLFLYGWERLPPYAHFASGIMVGVSGVASGVLVIAANGWMNSPRGFRWVDGRAVDVDPIAAMFNDAWASQAIHMVIASFIATGFGAAGLHAARLLRGKLPALHGRGMRIALAMGAVASLLQPISGDHSAKDVAKRQPAKLAAMEAHYHTQPRAALAIGGIPDDEARELRGAIHLPYLLSFLAHGDPNAVVIGLDQIPRDQWPPTLICHVAFQIMVGAGALLSLLGLGFFVLRRWRPSWVESRWFLRAVALSAPLGFIAVEAGWTVTEVGRQPWIIYGVMRTKDAVSPMPGLVWSLSAIVVVYAVLSVITWFVTARLIVAFERGHVPGPPQARSSQLQAERAAHG